MITKDNINRELWDVIKVHYEKECYTDCLKDACLYIIQLVQEKSELDNLDGEKLITNVFSESNPKLLINNNQTITEKDEQRGFGFFLRGIVCAIRNPISHKNGFKFSKMETDSILLFISNYLLPKLDDSRDFGYVDDWFDFIFVSNSNDSVRYSNTLLNCMTKKIKISLLTDVVNKLHSIKEGKYKYLINQLYNVLTKKEQSEIRQLLNEKLIKAGDDRYLRMFFDHFNPVIWNELDDLVKIRIEELVFNEIKEGRVYIDETSGEDCCDGTLGTWVSQWIDYFSNKDNIIRLLFKKLNDSQEGKYVLEYFLSIIDDDEYLKIYSDNIKKGLNNGKVSFKKLLETRSFLAELDEDDVFNQFKKEFDSFEEKPDYIFEDLPF